MEATLASIVAAAAPLVFAAVGESITEVQIGDWLKSSGDRVEVDQPDLQVKQPTVGHGIAGVDGQIHDHLFDLVWVGLDGPG